jgi:hypothetical protein
VQTSRHCSPSFAEFCYHHGHFIQTDITISILIKSVEDLFDNSLVFSAQNALDVFLIQGIVAFRYKGREDTVC